MRFTHEQSLMIQTIAGRVFIFILAPAIFLFLKISGYRIRDLEKTRKNFKKQFMTHQGPWLICANHLTMIDSVILAYAMMSISRSTFRFDLIPWNVPEKNNFQNNLFSSLLCYFLKCIPITRLGDRDSVKSTLDKCEILLIKKQNLMLFPEGTRSRTGCIDVQNFPYGVGRLLRNVPECMVLCIYARGDGQETYSSIPKRKETFTVKSEVIRPTSKFKGLKAQRDYAGQIIGKLSKMEIAYYAEQKNKKIPTVLNS